MLCPFKVQEYVSKLKGEVVDCEGTGCELWMSDFGGNSGCSLRMLPEILSQWMVLFSFQNQMNVTKTMKSPVTMDSE